MNNQSKIRLSSLEMKLVTNTKWILTKNAVLQKAIQVLELLQASIATYLEENAASFPADVVATSPKISKGENYKGLPYRVLDYPRCFHKENILAVRSFFWWGNFFSITLQLSGRYKKMYAGRIITAYPIWKKKDYFICSNDDPWEHHFEKDNYVPAGEWKKAVFEKNIRVHSFIKLANKIPLEQWNEAPAILFGYFKEMMDVLA